MAHAPTILADLTEKEWQTQVVQLAKLCGWRKAFHVYDSRRSHSGFPDLVLVRDRIIYLEFKTEKGRLSPAQAEWLQAIRAAGGEAYVARPHHLDHVAALLRHRGHGLHPDCLPLEHGTDAEIARAV